MTPGRVGVPATVSTQRATGGCEALRRVTTKEDCRNTPRAAPGLDYPPPYPAMGGSTQ
jgi:hypothetical protein